MPCPASLGAHWHPARLEPLPGRGWVCIGAAIDVDLALDNLAISPTDEYVRQQIRLRAEWEGMQELDRACLPG